MNLIQQAEQLKTIPDAQLAMMMQHPSVTPPWLVMTEMQRRDSMRKAAQAETGGNPMDQQTVAQEMVQNMSGMQQAGAQQGMQQGSPQQQAPQGGPQGGPQRMAEGGQVSLSDYFDQMQGAPPQIDPNAPVTTLSDLARIYGPGPRVEDELSRMRSMRGKSRLEDLASELEGKETEVRSRKTKPGDILMQLGLALAASRRPDALGAIGEAGLAALQGHMSQKERNRAEADAYARQRAGVLGQLQQSDDVLFREAGELARAGQSGRNTEIMTLEQAKQGARRDAQAAERQRAQLAAQQQIAELTDQRARDLAAAKNAAEEKAAEVKFQRELEKLKLEKSLERKSGGGDEDSKVFKKLTAAQKMAEDYDKAAKALADQAMMASGPEREKMSQQINRLRAQAEMYRAVTDHLAGQAGLGMEVVDPDEVLRSAKPAAKYGDPGPRLQIPVPTMPAGKASQTHVPSSLQGISDWLQQRGK